MKTKTAPQAEPTITITVSEAKHLLWILDNIASLNAVADALHDNPEAFSSIGVFIETINELNLNGSDSDLDGLDHMLRDHLKRKTGMDFGFGCGYLSGSPPATGRQ